MSGSENQMYPDHDHVHRWGDDATLPGPVSGSGFLPVRGPAIALGIGISCLIVTGCLAVLIVTMLFTSGCSRPQPACVVNDLGNIVNQPCVITAETEAQYQRAVAKARAEGLRRLREQHKDIDKTMRDFRMP